MQDAFLAPRFVGKRFESSTIPLDVLKDLAVLEDFVRALARDAFLRAHRDRQRVPSGFIGGMSLQLAAVTSGSAVAEITLVAEAPGLFGSPLQLYYESGRDTLLEAIAKAARGEDSTQLMPADLFGYFDSFGRGLQADEAIEFDHRKPSGPIRYTPEIRQRANLRYLRGSTSRRVDDSIRQL